MKPKQEVNSAVILEQMVSDLLAHAAGPDPSLSRLVEFHSGVQAVFHLGIRVQKIPEPSSNDPVRKALAACICERMAECFSEPPHSRQEIAPDWCATAPTSPVQIWLVSREFAADAPVNGIFAKRNFIALERFMSFA